MLVSKAERVTGIMIVLELPLNTEVLEGGHIDLLCLSTYINPGSFSETGLC